MPCASVLGCFATLVVCSQAQSFLKEFHGIMNNQIHRNNLHCDTQDFGNQVKANKKAPINKLNSSGLVNANYNGRHVAGSWTIVEIRLHVDSR